MSGDRKKLEALLKWYEQSIGDDLIAAIIVNRDGLVMTALTHSGSSGKNEIDENVIGGVSAIVEPVLKRITKEFNSGSFGTGTFDTEEYRLIFCEAGPEAVFITVINAVAGVDPVFPVAYIAAEKIARILDGRTVSPVIWEIANFSADTKKLKKFFGKVPDTDIETGLENTYAWFKKEVIV